MDGDAMDPIAALSETIELLDGSTRERLSAIQGLQNHVDACSLGRDELNLLTDAVILLLKDNNFKVCVGALKVAIATITKAGEHFKSLAPLVIPSLIERLGDGKVAVRTATLGACYAIIDALGAPTIVHDRFTACWKHKNSHIRDGVLHISIYCLKAYGTKFTGNKREVFIQNVVSLLADSSSAVRETAMSCVETAYEVLGAGLRKSLQDYGIRPAHMKEINLRLDKIQPVAAAPEATRKAAAGAAGKGERRGRFGDGGGVTQDGSTPEVKPVPIKSVHELGHVMDDLKAVLSDTTEDWHARMDYMMKLEGIVTSNGKHAEALAAMLNGMRSCFVEQALDRRSAVSRQACHLLTVIAEHMGSAADGIVENLVPVLFKVVVISVQVQAEAAHRAIKDMMHACHVGKLIVHFSDNLKTSRNAKLRSACIDYVHVVLEAWDRHDYDHYLSHLEAGLKSALSDASKDVRARARDAFGVFRTVWPEQGNAIFKTLSTSVQKALMQGNGAGTGGRAQTTGASRQPLRRQQLKSEFVNAQKSIAAIAAADEEAIAQGGDVFWPKKDAHDRAAKPRMGSSAKASTARVGKASGPGSDAHASDHEHGSPRSSSVSSGDKSPRDKSSTSSEGVGDWERESAAESRRAQSPAPVVFTLKTYVDGLGARSLGWSAKVEMNRKLRGWLLEKGPLMVGEVSPYLQKILYALVEFFGDPHHKVVSSSLEAFHVLLPYCLHMLEPFVEMFCPPIFLKMVDTKEHIRSVAAEVLMLCGQRYAADALVPVLIKALHTYKPPRARIAVLEFSVKYFRSNKDTASSAPITQWVATILPLICEKVVEVRRAAAAALVRVYQSMDAAAVLEGVLSLPPLDQNTVRKAVLPFVGPSFDDELMRFATAHPRHGATLGWMREEREREGEREREREGVGVGEGAGQERPNAQAHAEREQDDEEEEGEEGQESAGIARDSPLAAMMRGPPEAPAYAHPTPPLSGKASPYTTQAYEPPSHSYGYGLAESKAKYALKEKNTGLEEEREEEREDVGRGGEGRGGGDGWGGKPKGAEMHDLGRILDRLAVRGVDQELALRQFSTLVRTQPTSVWEVFADDALGRLFDGVASDKPGVTSCALLALAEFAAHQQQLARRYAPDLMDAVLDVVHKRHLEIKQSANECLSAVATHGDRGRCIDAMVTYLAAVGGSPLSQVEQNSAVVSILRAMGKALSGLHPGEVASRLQSVLPHLLSGFNSADADVRKSTVFCLVDIYASMGEALLPHLSSLSAAQLKLLTIYIGRRGAKANGGGMHRQAAVGPGTRGRSLTGKENSLVL